MAKHDLPVFLPGDYLPILQRPEGTADEAASAAAAAGAAAIAVARSYDWSAIRMEPSLCIEPQHQQKLSKELRVEVEGSGTCFKAKTASMLLPYHVLPPYSSAYVSISQTCRYTPRLGDTVIGIVASKGTEYYGV